MTEQKLASIEISEAALRQRINRVLRSHGRHGQRLYKSHPRDLGRQGPYYVCNLNTNCVVDKYFTLEQLGRKLGVLHDNECLADEDSE